MIWRFLILATPLALGAAPAKAHPHAWIDLESKVLLDDAGRVAALQLDWVFDDYYTVALADEVAVSEQIPDEFWTEIAAKNISNLTDYDYFTVIEADGVPVELAKVERYEGGLRDGRMWMRFDVPLAEPIDPRSTAITFSVFDPTYYIEIAHREGDVVAIEGDGADRCQSAIVQPNPTLDEVSLAASVDQDESPSDELGALFAETVTISCF